MSDDESPPSDSLPRVSDSVWNAVFEAKEKIYDATILASPPDSGEAQHMGWVDIYREQLMNLYHLAECILLFPSRAEEIEQAWKKVPASCVDRIRALVQELSSVEPVLRPSCCRRIHHYFVVLPFVRRLSDNDSIE